MQEDVTYGYFFEPMTQSSGNQAPHNAKWIFMTGAAQDFSYILKKFLSAGKWD